MGLSSIIQDLSEVIERVSKFKESAEITSSGPTSNKTSLWIFKNIDELRIGITILDKVGILSDQVSALKDTAFFQTGSKQLSIVHGEGNTLVTKVDQLYILVVELEKTLKGLLPGIKPDSIRIKLPPTSDFEDLSSISSELHKIFSQSIYHDDIDGQVEIMSVENGSIWFNVFLGSAAAVTLIAAVT